MRLAAHVTLLAVLAAGGPARAQTLEKFQKQVDKVAPADLTKAKKLCVCIGGSENGLVGRLVTKEFNPGVISLQLECRVPIFQQGTLLEIGYDDCRTGGGVPELLN